MDDLKTMFTPFMPFSSQTLHELLGHEGYIAGPLEFREVEDDGDTHIVLTGDYASWVGSWAPERACRPARRCESRSRCSASSIRGRSRPRSCERMEAARPEAA